MQKKIYSTWVRCVHRVLTLTSDLRLAPVLSKIEGTSGLFTLVFALSSALLAPGSSALAQPVQKIPRIGVLFIGGRNQPHLESFKQGLKERGYTEGKNILLELRYAEGNYDRLADLAGQFVREKVDIIVTTSTISARAARQQTKTIPIVITTVTRLRPALPIAWQSQEETLLASRFFCPL